MLIVTMTLMLALAAEETLVEQDSTEREWVSKCSQALTELEMIISKDQISFEDCQRGWNIYKHASFIPIELENKSRRILTKAIFNHIKNVDKALSIERLTWALEQDIALKSKQKAQKMLLNIVEKRVERLLNLGQMDDARILVYKMARKPIQPFTKKWEYKLRRRIRLKEKAPDKSKSKTNLKCNDQLTGYHLCTNAAYQVCHGRCGHRIECPCCFYSPTALKRSCEGH